MADLPRISDAEWKVMEAVWACPGCTAQEVVAALSGQEDWSPRTVKTMLSRLVRKGALRFQTAGKRYLYFARVPRQRCVRRETRSLLDRVFAGQAAGLLVHLVDSDELSAEQIQELRRLLRSRKGG